MCRNIPVYVKGFANGRATLGVPSVRVCSIQVINPLHTNVSRESNIVVI